MSIKLCRQQGFYHRAFRQCRDQQLHSTAESDTSALRLREFFDIRQHDIKARRTALGYRHAANANHR